MLPLRCSHSNAATQMHPLRERVWQGLYAKRFHAYTGPPNKARRRPAPAVDGCCEGGCAQSAQAASQVLDGQRNLPRHKCWCNTPSAVAAAQPASLSDDGDSAIGSFHLVSEDPTAPVPPAAPAPPPAPQGAPAPGPAMAAGVEQEFSGPDGNVEVDYG